MNELIVYLELHIELVVRPLYSEAFFGGKASADVKDQVRPLLLKGLLGFDKLARFDPFVAGSDFSLADCAAAVHLPLAASACQKVLGTDLVHQTLPRLRPYIDLVKSRPSMQKVNLDRKTNAAEMAALRAPKPV